MSPKLLWELEGVLGREKFSDLIHPDEVAQLLSIQTTDAVSVPDPADFRALIEDAISNST